MPSNMCKPLETCVRLKNWIRPTIIVYLKTLEEHKEHLKKAFEELHCNKLFINGKKSDFFLQEICYLGHIIPRMVSRWILKS